MRCLAAGLMLATALPAFADGKATVSSRDTQQPMQMDIQWTADKMRMDFPEAQEGYMLMRDGKGYMVTQQGGQTIVMDMSFFKGMADDMGGSFSSSQAQSVESLESTGERETVAGIEGDVYDLRWTDKGGESHADQLVLSNDALVREMLESFQAYRIAAMDEADPIGAAVLDQQLGILRYSDKFQIDEISDAQPSDDAFALPENAMSMEEMIEQSMNAQ